MVSSQCLVKQHSPKINFRFTLLDNLRRGLSKTSKDRRRLTYLKPPPTSPSGITIVSSLDPPNSPLLPGIGCEESEFLVSWTRELPSETIKASSRLVLKTSCA